MQMKRDTRAHRSCHNEGETFVYDNWISFSTFPIRSANCLFCHHHRHRQSNCDIYTRNEEKWHICSYDISCSTDFLLRFRNNLKLKLFSIFCRMPHWIDDRVKSEENVGLCEQIIDQKREKEKETTNSPSWLMFELVPSSRSDRETVRGEVSGIKSTDLNN